MTKFYELDNIGNLTGYHTYASDHKCIHSYKHVMYNSLGRSRRLSDTTVYTYSQSDLPACMSISNEDSFNTCLKSLKSCTSTQPCTVYLENSITLVEDQYVDNMPLDVRIRPVSKGYTTASYENYITPTLELSGVSINFRGREGCNGRSLDISGVNLKVHDVSNGLAAINACNLMIWGGSHQFYNNTNIHEDASGGAISCNTLTIQNVDMLDFCGNHAEYGGAIYTGGNSTFKNDISTVFTIAKFRHNSSTNGGAIYHYNGDLVFGGGNWYFNSNHSTNYGSAIGADSIFVGQRLDQTQYHPTNLIFTDNSGINTIWATSLNTWLACGETQRNIPGCKNQYKFYNNTTNAPSTKLAHIQLTDYLTMTGKWDFSNNIIHDKDSPKSEYGTIIRGHPASGQLPISINQADLSLDKVFKTFDCSSHAIQATSDRSYNYYKIHTDTNFVGQAAIDISNKRGNK